MQYRITYKARLADTPETIIVAGHLRAVFALIDYANKWNDRIERIEERESRTRKWRPSSITQHD